MILMRRDGRAQSWRHVERGHDHAKSGYVYVLDYKETLLLDGTHTMCLFAGAGLHMVPKGHGGRH